MSIKGDIKPCRVLVHLMSEKEKDSTIRLAAEIIKQRILKIGDYYCDIYNYRNSNKVKTLRKLTRISIPGFGCFYISATNAMFGKQANPSFTDPDDFDGPVKYFRVLKFRPYKWTKSEKFRMEESIG